ncbi:hypothetical protein NPIL_575031 [Nephila pilipes]|uniref:Uncharacterized protein n=1 Tax=Nephila pilipes TaxID=299642 RepID=A0A8X6UJF5_NEPPI|nr:hypothetical protein NPIL_575031 [Nephila pilipes]
MHPYRATRQISKLNMSPSFPHLSGWVLKVRLTACNQLYTNLTHLFDVPYGLGRSGRILPVGCFLECDLSLWCLFHEEVTENNTSKQKENETESSTDNYWERFFYQNGGPVFRVRWMSQLL